MEGACEGVRRRRGRTMRSYGLDRVCSLVGALLAAVSLLDELITTSRVLDSNSCRGLCGIPASITRKKDLVEALLLQTRCPHKRRAVIRHLTDNITANALRLWMKGVAGCRVPDSKVMGRGRAGVLLGSTPRQTAVGSPRHREERRMRRHKGSALLGSTPR